MTVAGPGARRACYFANAKEKGLTVCKGLPGLRLTRLEDSVPMGLREELMTLEAVDCFRREFAARQAEEDRDRQSRHGDVHKNLARGHKAIDGCMHAIFDHRATPATYTLLKDAEEKKADLEEEIANLSSAALEISSDLAALYRAQVDALTKTLSNREVAHRASEILREFIERITIRHDVELCHMALIEGKLIGLLWCRQQKGRIV